MSEAQLEKRICPKCRKSVVPVPIAYGYPSPDLFEDADAGRVQLGGCVISGDDPQWACPACEAPHFEDEDHERRYRRGLGPEDEL
jgi:rubrerythrin